MINEKDRKMVLGQLNGMLTLSKSKRGPSEEKVSQAQFQQLVNAMIQVVDKL